MNPDQTASKAAWPMNMVQKQEIDQTIIGAHYRKMGNIGHGYAHRSGDRIHPARTQRRAINGPPEEGH